MPNQNITTYITEYWEFTCIQYLWTKCLDSLAQFSFAPPSVQFRRAGWAAVSLWPLTNSSLWWFYYYYYHYDCTMYNKYTDCPSWTWMWCPRPESKLGSFQFVHLAFWILFPLYAIHYTLLYVLLLFCPIKPVTKRI